VAVTLGTVSNFMDGYIPKNYLRLLGMGAVARIKLVGSPSKLRFHIGAHMTYFMFTMIST